MTIIDRIIIAIRWIARMWACLVALIVVLMLVIPDSNAGPRALANLSPVDIIGLGFYFLAALGLLLAWRWELAGAIVTIVCVIGHELIFYIQNGFSNQYFRGNAVVGSVFIIPAVLFLISWRFSSKKQERGNSIAK